MNTWFAHLKNLFSVKVASKSLEGLTGPDRANAVFQNLVLEGQVPGMAVSIVKGGKIILEKGYGYTDLENKIPVAPQDTIFRIASISKCITGLAFGKMVEEGLVDWDDSFYQHVPYYPKKQYDFSLRQLANHTAGIRGYRGKEFALNRPYTIKESIGVFQNDPLLFEPGKGYLYNSFDFVLLSLAMQEACDKPFGSYVKEKVLKPLGMEATLAPEEGGTPYQTKKRISNFYTKHISGFKRATSVDNNYKLAGGGYLSSSADIVKMGQAILNKALLRPETYEQLFAPQFVNGTSTYYGLGFQVSQDAYGRNFVGHVGSSVGGYSNFFVYPEQETIVAVLINSTDPKVQNTLDEAIASILDADILIS